MEKQKILNQIKDGHKFIEMLVQAFPKARNQANNIGWVLNAIKDEINKPDAPQLPKTVNGSEVIGVAVNGGSTVVLSEDPKNMGKNNEKK